MAIEGSFPKSDGDILYASEVNRFGNFKFLGADETDTFQSGTDVQVLGSIVVNTGSLFNPMYIKGACSILKIGDGGNQEINNFRIQISGASTNQQLNVGSNFSDNVKFLEFTSLIGSPLTGYMFGNVFRENTNENASTGKIAGTRIINLDTTQTVVINVAAQLATSGQMAFSFVGFGENYT